MPSAIMTSNIRTSRGGIVLSPGASAPPPLPALVQQAVASDADGLVTAAISPPSSGNSLIACLCYDSLSTIDTPPSYDGTDLTQGPTATVAGVTVEIWYIHNVGGGAEFVLMGVGGLGTRSASLNVSEWSGLTNAAPEDTDSNTGVASATVTTNSVTPISARSIIIAIGGWTLDDYASGPTNGFTRMTPTGVDVEWQESAYLVLSAIAAKSSGWGLSAGINWAAVIAAFGAP